MKKNLLLIACFVMFQTSLQSKTSRDMLGAAERLVLPQSTNTSKTTVVTNHPDGTSTTATSNYDLDQDNALVAIAQRVGLLEDKLDKATKRLEMQIDANTKTFELKIAELANQITELKNQIKDLIDDPSFFDKIKSVFSSDKTKKK